MLVSTSGIGRFQMVSGRSRVTLVVRQHVMPHCFDNPDAWSGGTIDALMFFGPRSVLETIQVAKTLWNFDRLAGPFRQRHVDPQLQPHVTSFEFTDDGCEQLIGTYKHTCGTLSPFIHTTIRDEDGLWIYAGIPMGGMPVEWDVGAYPFDDGKPVTWLPPLIEELRTITAYLDSAHSVLAAVYGWLDVTVIDIVAAALAGEIPGDRWYPIETWSNHSVEYFPMTRMEALIRKSV